MFGTRGMSVCEFLHLLSLGEVSSSSCPFAVVGQDEELVDTEPRPPVGSVLLFDRTSQEVDYTLGFGWSIGFEVPESEVCWRGLGTYKSKDPFTDEMSVWILKEFGVYSLKREWMVRIDSECYGDQLDDLVDHLKDEFGWILDDVPPSRWEECIRIQLEGHCEHDVCLQAILNGLVL